MKTINMLIQNRNRDFEAVKMQVFIRIQET